MYERYTITKPAELIESAFLLKSIESFDPLYNASPTCKLPIITNQDPDKLQFFYWGLISKLANNKSISPKLFNLKASAATSRPMYIKQLATNRCLILADGFFVWKQVSKKQQIPFYCYFKDRMLFAIAGVWEDYEDLDGNLAQSFNMITVDASGPLSDYQEDMPAILDFEQCKAWLAAEEIQDVSNILESCSVHGIQIHAVSPQIKDLNLNNADVIKPAPPSDQYGNFTLFN